MDFMKISSNNNYNNNKIVDFGQLIITSLIVNVFDIIWMLICD